MTDFAKQVYEFLKTIPRGKVATYSQIAAALGHKNSARAVGNILHANPDTDFYPCHKVVNSQGKLAKNFALGIEEQKKRLEAEGIVVINYTVNLNIYGI